MSNRLLFCVFSYNRGEFLENCIRSIEQCIPEADIAIFDDDSTEPHTRKALERLSGHHEVLKPGNQSTHKLGGLYGNMQSALEYARERDLVCFIQDDMQVVRPVTSEEIKILHLAFEQHPKLAFLHPCFLKGINRQRDENTLTYDSELNAYKRKATDQSAGQYFSAILITRPARLLDQDWHFKASEPANDSQARNYFETIGHMFAPFMMWLPEVPAYRGKRKTLALRLAEKRRGCGLFPYEILSEQDVEQLLERPKDVLPFAEDFLVCSNSDLQKPWGYYPMQGSRFLKKLNSLELALRNLF
ncbi:glycosyltransferase family A protein [Marinobacter sp. CHS3-4]|uniref:glycosyltransferase family A protein n=1 Tax=Marinobacter sp. CHS3-4 TaxID=3045174 RepID=UPI0024B54003|nr:glycosyltransferase family A protein [Marinobacter sp. CHS3-4]MDI9246699.1 glycosyltransferase family A protein [Marinobacter sp. CHS3-4]